MADISKLIALAKRLGLDPDNLGEMRGLQALQKFHADFQDDVRTRAEKLAEMGAAYHQEGLLPLEVGTRFVTPKDIEYGRGPYTVIGHYVDGRRPDRYGYHVQRGIEGDPDYERSMMLLSDPNHPLADQLEELASKWTVFRGPKKYARGGLAQVTHAD